MSSLSTPSLTQPINTYTKMITIKQNPNFTKFFQVFAFGQYIDEVERRSKALRIATKLAKQHKQDFINVDGLMQEVCK